MDYIILIGNDYAHVQSLIDSLKQQFTLKDLGILYYFLGIKVLWSSHGVFFTQQKYTLDLLQKAKMDKANGISTPYYPQLKLTLSTGERFSNPTLYRSIVGGLQYLSFTQPDILYSINKVAQFMHQPTNIH